MSNADLEKIVDTSDEWIVSRTGMKERRIAQDDEFTSDMGAKAAKIALDKADFKATDIDLIIVATLSPDYIFPSTSCLIQEKIGATNAAAFDIQAACSGMIYGLSTAKSFIESGAYKNILVIASEKLSSIIDYQDRNTCVLFGDGSAACLVSSRKGSIRIGEYSLGCDGGQSNLLMMPGGGSRNPASHETVDKRMHYLQMDGKEVFRHAVRRMEAASIKCIQKSNLSESEIDYLVPHQANIRIIEAIAKRCHIPNERVIKTIQNYGNTSASSIGITLDELLDKNIIKQNEHLLLVAFGAGLTWGSMILTSEEV